MSEARSEVTEVITEKPSATEPGIEIMEEPSTSEKDGFQLQTINSYGTKADNLAENGGGETSVQPTIAPLSEDSVQDDDFIDPDNLGFKEKVLIRIFPFILKYPWLRNKILKKKTENDGCKFIHSYKHPAKSFHLCISHSYYVF